MGDKNARAALDDLLELTVENQGFTVEEVREGLLRAVAQWRQLIDHARWYSGAYPSFSVSPSRNCPDEEVELRSEEFPNTSVSIVRMGQGEPVVTELRTLDLVPGKGGSLAVRGRIIDAALR